MARQSEPFARQTVGVPVLITRPEAEARAFAGLLKQRFGGQVRPVVAPLMAPRFLDATLPTGDFAGVIFTSVQGVEGARRLGPGLPTLAFCVGQKTAHVARAAGFEARSADGDAEALLALILANRPAGKLLHIRGQDTRGDLEERLNSAGIETESLIVYQQEPLPLNKEAEALLLSVGRIIVPVFSPRTAAILAAALPSGFKAGLDFVAMSPSVAHALAGAPRDALVISRQPDAEGVLDAIGTLLAASPMP
ncbi:MAG: uroporphyrinogen-III synthase [Tabrizicola sp.]|nr:uroporphyrinogen-III synthase [Tabrizicola sp.]